MEVEEGRNPEEEQFRRLAAALGEPLEAVWGMPEQERRHLILLLLEGGEQPADQGAARPEQPEAATKQPESVGHQHSQQEQLHAAAVGRSDVPAAKDDTEAGLGAVKLESQLDLKDGAPIPPRMMELRKDAWKVMRMLRGTRNEGMGMGEVEAYLEAHWLNPRRVEVVVDELSGVAEEEEEEVVTLAEEAEVVDKGKGMGKTTSRAEVAGLKRHLVEQPEQGGKLARIAEVEVARRWGRGEEGKGEVAEEAARTVEQEGRGIDDPVIEITDSPVKVRKLFLTRVCLDFAIFYSRYRVVFTCPAGQYVTLRE